MTSTTTTFNSDQVSTGEACLKSTYDQNSTMDLLQEVLHGVWLENPKGGREIVFWRSKNNFENSKSSLVVAQLSERRR